MESQETNNAASQSPQQQQQQLHQLQQQQQQQEQQRQLQQQQQQQQQQRQLQQQFQQQFHQQSTQNSNDVMGSNDSMTQNQQLYNQLQSMHPSMSSENVYSQLAHQLMAHNAETSGGSAPGPSSSNQMPNSYYPSPSYTDSSVLGQLNMSTLTSTGIKQFDGFNNDQSGSDPLLQALLPDQQQQKKSQPTMGSASGFMQQPPPFAGSTSNPTQSRMTSSLGMISLGGSGTQEVEVEVDTQLNLEKFPPDLQFRVLTVGCQMEFDRLSQEQKTKSGATLPIFESYTNFALNLLTFLLKNADNTELERLQYLRNQLKSIEKANVKIQMALHLEVILMCYQLETKIQSRSNKYFRTFVKCYSWNILMQHILKTDRTFQSKSVLCPFCGYPTTLQSIGKHIVNHAETHCIVCMDPKQANHQCTVPP